MSKLGSVAFRSIGAVAAGVLLVFGQAHARGELTAGAGLAYTDNVALASDNRQDEWIATGLLGYSYEQEGAERTGHFDGLLQYRNYLDGTYSDEVIGAIDAEATFKLRPEQLHWSVRDYYTQAMRDPLAEFTPDNWQGVNVFSTGPDLIFRFGRTTRAELGARFEHQYFQESDADNIRLGVHGEIERQSTPTRTLSARYQVMDVDYDNGVSDMLRQDATVAVRQRVVPGRLTIEAGYTHIERDSAADVDGARGRAEMIWEISQRTELSALVMAQYTDEGTSLLGGSLRNGSRLFVDEQVTGDIYYIRLGQVQFYHNAPAMDFRFRGSLRDEEYEVLTLRDREVASVGLDITRRMRPQLTGLLFAELRRTDYLNVGREDDNALFGVALDYEVARNWFAGLSFRRDERDSTVAGRDYTENRVLFTVRYGEQFREESFNAR